jgi:hypothetical protein
MEPKETVELWLLVNVDSGMSGHRDIELYPVTLGDKYHNDEQPRYRNGSYDYEHNPYQYELGELRLAHSIGNTSYDRTPIEYNQLNYHRLYSVELEQAKRMVKTLESIGNKLEKVQKAEGSSANFGQYVLRFARAIGAKGVVVEIENTKRYNGWSTEYDYRQYTGGDMVWHINSVVDAARESLCPKMQEAA